MRLVGADLKRDRPANDFYETPQIAVEKLLEKESFEGSIWDPASGHGAICLVLAKKLGGNRVLASDVSEDPLTFGQKGVDFLWSYNQVDNIVVNPPFKLSKEFTLKALQLAKHKVALFTKLQFLEGLNRREEIFKMHPPSRVWVFVNRLSCPDGISTVSRNGGMLAFAWFVWENDTKGTVVDWID